MGQTQNYSTDSFFKGMKALLNSLPSEDEKSELIQTLQEARDFLEDLQILVESIPTIESGENLRQGLSRLDVLANRANDAPLRKLMGLRGSQNGRVKVKDFNARAMQLEREIRDSEETDVATLLEQSREPIAVLTELASSLGLRTRSKERKADLINRISTHVTNQRGYRLLRGESPD